MLELTAQPPTPGEILAFLQNPDSYPHQPERVTIIQTHISYVAIALPFVYKVKKPVDFGFLDFSTLEQRHHYCQLEVHLNRRLCAGIYQGVVPISRRQGALSFGAGEVVVEYAVKMRALREGYFLQQQLASITPEHLERLIVKLEQFYKAQTPSPEIAEWGRTENLKQSTDENFRQTEAVVGTLLSRPAFDAIRTYTEGFYRHQALLLNRRRVEGRIVDGHGDLHLEHIHLSPEAICIFDCIEFNERFRYLDVASDVAFLVMDLDFHQRRDLADELVRRLADALADPELLQMIDFYKCYRAYVRGKVEGMRSAQPEVPAREREASVARAKRYYQLALQYAVAGSRAAVIVLMGQVASGKTTQAKALAEALGWSLVSSDRVRKELAGAPLHQRGDARARARLYAPEMTERTYAALCAQAVDAARRGQGSLLDATYSSPRHRQALRDALQAHHVPCHFVELTASDETLRARLHARAGQRGLVTDARLDDFDLLNAHYHAPDALEDARQLRVDTDASTEEEVTHTILEAISCLNLAR